MALHQSADWELAVDDLASRWQRARRAALRSCLPDGDVDPDTRASELELLARALRADAAAAEKAVFENSLALGRGFRRHHGVELTLGELPAVLPRLGLPCANGLSRLAVGEPGLFLLRQGCEARGLGTAACSLYREAMQGLLLGLTRGLAHSRHGSVTHGDEVCLDVIHHEGSALRYGAIPAEMQPVLDTLVRRLRAFDSTVSVELLGMTDGALHYRLSRGPNVQLNVQACFERSVRRRFPELRLHEASPRPVLHKCV